MKNTPPSAQTEWSEAALEELWDYLCVTLDIVGDKKKLDLIRKFVELKIKQERTRLLSVESMKMENIEQAIIDNNFELASRIEIRNDLRKLIKKQLQERQSILSEMEKGSV